MSHTIYPCLWFEREAAEAAAFYLSIFKDSRQLSANPAAIHVELNGSKFMLLNGKQPSTGFNESTSFVITCDTQEEVDHYWINFTKDGKEKMCGWCEDRYGVSWQIVPRILGQLMSDPERAPRVIDAFLKMKKFNIERLLNA